MFNKWHEAATSVGEYFFVATFTWLILNDEAAHIAAMASGMTAAGEQRASTLVNLEKLTSQLDQEDRRRVAQLSAFLQSKDWDLGDAFRARKALMQIDREYWRAMSNWYGRADPDVFVRRHPEMRDVRDSIARKVAEAPKIRRWW
ncbi:MAG: hypothetical protein ABSD56_03880 [Bryobacteraceae bacterium]